MNYPQYPYMGQNALSNPYQPQRQEVVRVNGRNGAEAYQMAPNSSILLLDETASIVWLKITDGAGYPTITPYSITPYQPEPDIDVRALADRISKLEEMINGKSNTTSARGKKPADE